MKVTPVVREYVERTAAELPRKGATILRSLLKPRLTGTALQRLGERGATIEPMLRNTANATVIRGGTKINVVRELDPEGIPVPLLQVGVTDGRLFSRAGIRTYGFLPMRLPEEFRFAQLIHAAGERIPVDALEFGAEAAWRAVRRLH